MRRWILALAVALAVAVILALARPKTHEPFEDDVCIANVAVDADDVPDWLLATPGCLSGVEVFAGTPVRFERERLRERKASLTVLCVLSPPELMYAALLVPAARHGPSIRSIADWTGQVSCADAHAAWTFQRIATAHGLRFDVRVQREPDADAAQFVLCTPGSRAARRSAERVPLQVIDRTCDRPKLEVLLPFASITTSALPNQTDVLTVRTDCLIYASVAPQDAPAIARAVTARLPAGAAVRPTAYHGTLPTATHALPERPDPTKPHRGELPMSVQIPGPVGIRNVSKTSTGYAKAFLDVFPGPPALAACMRGDTIVLSNQRDSSHNGTWYVNDARGGVLAVSNAVVLRLTRQHAKELTEQGIVSSVADLDAQIAGDTDSYTMKIAVRTPVFVSSVHPFTLGVGDPVRVDELEFFGKVHEIGDARVTIEGQSDEDAGILQDASGALFRCFDRSVAEADCPDDLWDRPCLADSECPFYVANQNYANAFGGCRDGYCEMPVGVRNRTFRTPNPDDTPLCYNCLGDDTMQCCDQQVDAKFPTVTPDFAFAGDAELRRNALGPAGTPGARLAWHSI